MIPGTEETLKQLIDEMQEMIREEQTLMGAYDQHIKASAKQERWGILQSHLDNKKLHNERHNTWCLARDILQDHFESMFGYRYHSLSVQE